MAKAAVSSSSAAPAPILPVREGRDIDPGQSGKNKEVREWSETEDPLNEHVDTVASHAEDLGKRWAERQLKDGRKLWFNPMVPMSQRVFHITKAQCAAEIKTKFAMRVAEKKLLKRPDTEYTPQLFIESPKRTLADFLGPKVAAMTMAARVEAEGVQRLGKLTQATNGREMTPGALVAMPESIAIRRIPELPDNQLRTACHKAEFGGKRKLYKELVKAIAVRKVA